MLLWNPDHWAEASAVWGFLRDEGTWEKVITTANKELHEGQARTPPTPARKRYRGNLPPLSWVAMVYGCKVLEAILIANCWNLQFWEERSFISVLFTEWSLSQSCRTKCAKWTRPLSLWFLVFSLSFYLPMLSALPAFPFIPPLPFFVKGLYIESLLKKSSEAEVRGARKGS